MAVRYTLCAHCISLQLRTVKIFSDPKEKNNLTPVVQQLSTIVLLINFYISFI
jgi:hypothetical protein